MQKIGKVWIIAFVFVVIVSVAGINARALELPP